MSLISKTQRALDQIEFNYRVVDYGDRRVLVGKVGIDCGHLDAMFSASTGEKVLELVSTTNQRIPSGALPACLELTRLINCCLAFGVFNIDADRDLMVRASTIVSEEHLPAETVETMIAAAACAALKFVPAYLSVVYANESPELAFRRVMSQL